MEKRKAKSAAPKKSASDRRSERAFKITANVVESSLQTIKEVRSGG